MRPHGSDVISPIQMLRVRPFTKFDGSSRTEATTHAAHRHRSPMHRLLTAFRTTSAALQRRAVLPTIAPAYITLPLAHKLRRHPNAPVPLKSFRVVWQAAMVSIRPLQPPWPCKYSGAATSWLHCALRPCHRGAGGTIIYAYL